MMPGVRTLLTGLGYGESPRWHADRLWLCNWGAQQVVAVDLDGTGEVVARVPTTLPFSIDWLPDGRLLVGVRAGSAAAAPGTGRVAGDARGPEPVRAAVQRDRRGPARQRLRQRAGRRAGHAGRFGAPGG